jgi:5-enolpyruvylshikimate-3-phosphate synthase
MWALGGEFITELNYDPPLRKRPVDRVLRDLIRYGGPLLRDADEEQQASFDSTCEMFRRFLGNTAP